MIVEHPFVYEAVVRLPRSRHPKTVLLSERIPIEVREVGSDEAPVVLEAPASLAPDAPVVRHRASRGRFYVPIPPDGTPDAAATAGAKASAMARSTAPQWELEAAELCAVRDVVWSDRDAALARFVSECSTFLLVVDGTVHAAIDPPVVTLERLRAGGGGRFLPTPGLPVCLWDLADGSGNGGVGEGLSFRIRILRPDLVSFDRDGAIAAELARSALAIPDANQYGRPYGRGGPLDPPSLLEHALATQAGVDEIVGLTAEVWNYRAGREAVPARSAHMLDLEAFSRRRHLPDPRTFVACDGDPAPGRGRTRFAVHIGEFTDRHVVEAEFPSYGSDEVLLVATVSLDGGEPASVLRDGVSFLVPVPSERGRWGAGPLRAVVDHDETAAPVWQDFMVGIGMAKGGGFRHGGGDLDAETSDLRSFAEAGLVLVDGLLHRRVHEPLLELADEKCFLVLDSFVGRDGRRIGRGRAGRANVRLPLSASALVVPVGRVLEATTRRFVPPVVEIHRPDDVSEAPLGDVARRLLGRALADVRLQGLSSRSVEALLRAGPAPASSTRRRLGAGEFLSEAVAVLSGDPAAGIVVRREAFRLLDEEILPRLERTSGRDAPEPDGDEDCAVFSM